MLLYAALNVTAIRWHTRWAVSIAQGVDKLFYGTTGASIVRLNKKTVKTVIRKQKQQKSSLYFLLPFFLVCCPSASPSFCLFVRTFFLSYFRRTGVGAAKVISVFVYYRAKVISFSTHTHTYTQLWMSTLCYCSPIARGALGVFWCRGGPSAKDRAFPAFVPLSTLP